MKRRVNVMPIVVLLASVAELLFGAPPPPAVVENDTPVTIDSRRQLFIDDFLISKMTGLKRTLHQPTDYENNPVIIPERPWEHRRIIYGSVYYFEKEKKFKCWYLAANIYDSRPGARGYRKEHHVPLHEAAFICYAESDDGIRWRKPNLGIHEFRGSKDNNIVLTCPGSHFDGPSVVYTPRDTERPYKMMAFIGRWPYKEDRIKKQWGEDFQFGVKVAAHYAWSSRDGIHFQPMNDGRHVLQANDRSMFWYDPVKKHYVGSAKYTYQGKRAQHYVWSTDFVHWKRPGTWIMRADERDHPRDESEGSYGFRYQAGYLGFCEMRRIRETETKINWELMVSRDDRNWSRPIRKLFLPDGPQESWRYQVMKVFANPPIERNGQLLIYYSGKTGLSHAYTGTGPNQAVCRARLRTDGFVSIDADEKGGTLVTRSVVLKGQRLHINADATGGEIRVAIQDAAGKPIPAYSANACQPITGNTLDGTVSWDNATSLEPLAEKPVQLVFTLRNAQLYSVWAE